MEIGEQGCAQLDGVVTYSCHKSLSLEIVQVNAIPKDSPTNIHITSLVHYIEEEAQTIRATSPLVLMIVRAPSSQSFLSLADIKKLILETQENPLASDII